MVLGISRDIARIISNVLHPYVVFSLVVTLVAYQESAILVDWIKWAMVTLLSAYLLPLIYMKTRVVVVTHNTGNRVRLRTFFREQPNEMVILACIFGLPSGAILYILGYPGNIIATLVGVAATALIIALVNRVYRASFHIALFTSMMVSLIIIFGLPSLVAIPFIMLLGASRYYLGEHTPVQLTTGFLIGLAATIAVFRGFSILGLA